MRAKARRFFVTDEVIFDAAFDLKNQQVIEIFSVERTNQIPGFPIEHG